VAFIDTLPVAAAEGDVHALYERQQTHWGYVPNYAKVFAHRPEVMARWASLQSTIRRSIGSRRFEIVTFAAALELRNSYCAFAHAAALAEHLTAAEIRSIVEEETPSALAPAEAVMVRFARRVARDAASITAGEVGELARHFDAGEIFDIVATAAGRAFFAKILDGLGVEADSTYLAVEEPMRRLLGRGRPIDFRPVERLSSTSAEEAPEACVAQDQPDCRFNRGCSGASPSTARSTPA
jgi:hypothetical protein